MSRYKQEPTSITECSLLKKPGHRQEPRMPSLLVQQLDDPSIPLLDHFVEEEVISVWQHLSSDGAEAVEPRIHLFSCRRVKHPFVAIKKLLEFGGVAVCSAEVIGFLVLRFKVKDINGEGDVVEIPVVLRV